MRLPVGGVDLALVLPHFWHICLTSTLCLSHPPKDLSVLTHCSDDTTLRLQSHIQRGWLAVQMLIEEGHLQPDAHLRITGHSLGGALAMMAAFDIAQSFPALRVQVGPAVPGLAQPLV